MNPFVGALVFSVALSSVASAQHAGDAAPALVWDKLKGNCPEHLDWESLRGKAVALVVSNMSVSWNEFSYWNELTDQFSGTPILLINVESGSEFLLDQALKRTASKTCILFDADSANQRNFKLPDNMPQWVVVNQTGLVAGYSKLQDSVVQPIEAVLNHAVETGLLDIPAQRGQTPPPPRDWEDFEPSYEVRISPGRKSGPVKGDAGLDFYVRKDETVRNLLIDLWGFLPGRAVFPDKLDDGRYDIVAHLPVKDPKLLNSLLRQAVEKRFGLQVEKAKLSRQVYILKSLGTASPQLQPSAGKDKSSFGARARDIQATAGNSETIRGSLEVLLKIPVIDETGLKGLYNYSASSSLSESEAPFDLAQQLGLKLVPEERTIEMWVVARTR